MKFAFGLSYLFVPSVSNHIDQRRYSSYLHCTVLAAYSICFRRDLNYFILFASFFDHFVFIDDDNNCYEEIPVL